MRHGGSVMAPDAELAVHYARELFGRRQESVRLWVVRRARRPGSRRPGPPPTAARSLVQEARRLRHARQAGRRARAVGPGQAEGSAGMTSPRSGRGRRPASTDLLATMADDEFVIGFSDSEWTGIAPLLEEDVAMSSLAQDELGHAAALYGLLADLTGSDADALAYDREPASLPARRLLDHGRGDWAMTIARRYLYETADAVRLEALVDGSWAPLAELAGSWSARSATTSCTSGRGSGGWPTRRASRATASRPRLAILAPDAGTVFTPLDGEAALIDAGILAASMSELETRWRRSSSRLRPPRPGQPATDRDRRAVALITARRSTGSGASSTPCAAATRGRPGERGRDTGRDRPSAGGRGGRGPSSGSARRHGPPCSPHWPK